MNKIVREHYPASKLPEDLRQGMSPAVTVRIVMEVDDPVAEGLTFKELKRRVAELQSRPDFKPVTSDEAVARIRALRDEWDE